MDWDTIKSELIVKANSLGLEYIKRLEFEIKEIEKQGSNEYWIDLLESGKKFDVNKNGLVIAYLMGICSVDPIAANIKHNISYQPDFPDIDIDFLPNAREPIKEYITQKYGADKVCNVGSWLTYKPRLALKDAVRALGSQDEKMTDSQFGHYLEELLESIPKEFDDIDDLEKAKFEFPAFKEFANKFPSICDIAYRMVGRIKTQGRHAGGLIISSEPIGKHVPLTYDHKLKQHVSSWTEGFNQQLSKFGFVKFDLLGLNTMWDITVASQYVKENRNIEIDWQYMLPLERVLGRWRKIGEETWHNIMMDDEEILKLCNTQRVETVFQFETDFAMNILKEVGIKSYWDIVAATSLGRPGPMEQIPSYVENRDDPKKKWKNNLPEKMVKILEPTHGVIIFQEQLSNIWTTMCGLTVPESEKARKAVAKKKADELLKLEPKIINGLAKHSSVEFAKEWWEKMTKFGRYAFNLSHAAAYSVISWRCLFLKAYFPTEWWASVLSHTKPEKRAKYIGLARIEGIKFGTIDFNNLQTDFHAKHEEILPGLSIMKGIGPKASVQLSSYGRTSLSSLDEFMKLHSNGDKLLVNKTSMARLIKLGAFCNFHKNRRALWYYYIYKYTDNSDDNLRKKIIAKLDDEFGWNQNRIIEERKKMAADWKSNQKDKNKNVPHRINNWKPKKLEYTLEHFEKLFKNDYSLTDILLIEKNFYGFYWHSPMDLYVNVKHNIEDAKESGILECVIKDIEIAKSAKGNDYLRLTVTDGLEEVKLLIFGEQITSSDAKLFNDGVGIRVEVTWSDKFRSFSCKRGKQVVGLVKKTDYDKFYNHDKEDLYIDLENDEVESNSSNSENGDKNIIEEVSTTTEE